MCVKLNKEKYMLKNAVILTSIYTLLCGAIGYSAYNDTSLQNKTNLNTASQTATMTKEDSAAASKTIASVQDMIQKKYNNNNINVKVFQGTVVLRGYVNDEQMKQSIERDARKLSGVKNVTNLLTIRDAKLF